MIIHVNLDSGDLKAALERAASLLGDRTMMHEAMAQGIEGTVMAHLQALDARSPNTHYYGRAAQNLHVTADDSAGRVVISERGMALHYYGGRVLPVDQKNLAIPTDDVPLAGTEGRKGPREMGPLAFIPNRNGPSVTTGYLVEGEERTVTRGKNKGGTRTVPKPGGRLLYVLRGWTDHDPDPSVIPTDEALTAAARSGLDELLASFDEEGRP